MFTGLTGRLFMAKLVIINEDREQKGSRMLAGP